MNNKTIGLLVVAALMFGTSFGARPLFSDDCGTMDLGRSGIELGYDTTQTLGLLFKNSPIKNVECSLVYNLPAGTSIVLDQAELWAKIQLIEPDQNGVGYTASVKYSNVTKLTSLTAIVSKSDKGYCLDFNVGYLPNQALSVLLAAEYDINNTWGAVAEVSRSNVDWTALLGGRYHVNDDLMFDVAYTLPVTSGAPASTTIIGMSAEF